MQTIEETIKEFYAEWCKSTGRGGGVLIGSSIRELLQSFAGATSHQGLKWVRASEKLPELYPVNNSSQNHYELDGRKVDGYFLDNQRFEYFDPIIAGYRQLELDAFNRIQWLDESTPSNQERDRAIKQLVTELAGAYVSACKDYWKSNGVNSETKLDEMVKELPLFNKAAAFLDNAPDFETFVKTLETP